MGNPVAVLDGVVHLGAEQGLIAKRYAGQEDEEGKQVSGVKVLDFMACELEGRILTVSSLSAFVAAEKARTDWT